MSWILQVLNVGKVILAPIDVVVDTDIKVLLTLLASVQVCVLGTREHTIGLGLLRKHFNQTFLCLVAVLLGPHSILELLPLLPVDLCLVCKSQLLAIGHF